ncbi:hypothetical protein EJB05_30618, partial [Eragrostis curvula]
MPGCGTRGRGRGHFDAEHEVVVVVAGLWLWSLSRGQGYGCHPLVVVVVAVAWSGLWSWLWSLSSGRGCGRHPLVVPVVVDCPDPSSPPSLFSPILGVVYFALLRPGFESLLILVVWKLWKERNNRIFEFWTLQPVALSEEIIDEAHLWAAARSPGSPGVYSWKVHVTMFAQSAPDGTRRPLRIHEAPAPRATFFAGIEDASRQALAVLRYENADDMDDTQFRYYAQRPSASLEETWASTEGESLVMKETVRCHKATCRILTKVQDELADALKENLKLMEANKELSEQLAAAMDDEPIEDPQPSAPVPTRSPSRQQLRLQGAQPPH